MLRKWLLVLVCLSINLGCKADDERFSVVSVDLEYENLALFLNDESGEPFKRIENLAAQLEADDQQLIFAMNAGMYHPDFSPVGLLVIDGKEVSPLNQSNGAGNFFLKPNGVFFVSESGPQIVESSEYPALAQGAQIATQSGPLLARRGVIHPAFNENSTSRLIRNGVGVSGSKVFFVISKDPVTFYELAQFFLDTLQCQDALYLDGVVSNLYTMNERQGNHEVDLGPIIGVVQ